MPVVLDPDFVAVYQAFLQFGRPPFETKKSGRGTRIS